MAGSACTRRRLRLAAAAIALAATLGSAQAVLPPIAQPNWVELSPQNQQILAPLATDWNQLEFWRRKKWLEVAERYPRLGAEEQSRIQARMRAWAALTPSQRKAAREKYQSLQKASPEQREALKKKWLEYESLPDEEKKRFNETAARKPVAKPKPKPAGGHSIVKSAPARPAPTAGATAAAAPSAPATVSASEPGSPPGPTPGTPMPVVPPAPATH
jgi:Protein of unknown function (DUF3106)